MAIHAPKKIGSLLSLLGVDDKLLKKDFRIILDDIRHEVMDRKTYRQTKELKEDREKQLKEAQSNSDTGKIESLTEELKKITDYMNDGTHWGKSKKFYDFQENIREAVGIAIARSLKNILKKDESLWRHLFNAIKKPGGINPSYRPENPILWDVKY